MTATTPHAANKFLSLLSAKLWLAVSTDLMDEDGRRGTGANDNSISNQLRSANKGSCSPR
jgi:hypothetical protein